MSIAINTEKVSEVLLADGWHSVAKMPDGRRSSFDLDAYEYIDGEQEVGRGNANVLLGGGREPLIPATGFMFTELIDIEGFTVENNGVCIAGPLTAILAVRYSVR